jgi:hypothetical protein
VCEDIADFKTHEQFKPVPGFPGSALDGKTATPPLAKPPPRPCCPAFAVSDPGLHCSQMALRHIVAPCRFPLDSRRPTAPVYSMLKKPNLVVD